MTDKGAKKIAIDIATQKHEKSAKKERNNVLIDINPESDETDLVQLENSIRELKLDDVEWLGAQQIPIAYTLKKLRFVVKYNGKTTDADTIQEEIEKVEGVKSVDFVAAALS